MKDVKRLPEFDEWINGLKDRKTVIRLKRRIDRVACGNFGDHSSVGSGVYELREHFGPGWRMYYVEVGSVIIVMLGGGDKSTQTKDIKAAKALAKRLEE